MAEIKEGAIVKKGNSRECSKMAISILDEFGLPLGLLPVNDVIEVGFVRATGYFWILQEKRIDYDFKLIGSRVRYETEISGYITKNIIKKLKGVKAKLVTFMTAIHEMSVDDPPSGSAKLTVKGLAGVTMSFPVEAFALGQ